MLEAESSCTCLGSSGKTESNVPICCYTNQGAKISTTTLVTWTMNIVTIIDYAVTQLKA